MRVSPLLGSPRVRQRLIALDAENLDRHPAEIHVAIVFLAAGVGNRT